MVGVGWDGDTLAVPNDPRTVGWFTPSAHREDLIGTSLVAGHVADTDGRPGALAPLVGARVGDVVVWRDALGRALRFRVVSIRRFPRAGGLPLSLLRPDGPHTLQLVTCTHRIPRGEGFHYTDNLVVSAVQMAT
jgi:hypothetical protein